MWLHFHTGAKQHASVNLHAFFSRPGVMVDGIIREWASEYAKANPPEAPNVENHASDCAVHNEPHKPNDPCDCGVAKN